MIRTIKVGLDVGTQTTRIVVCEVLGEDTYPKVLGVGMAPTSGMHHGYVVNQAQVSASIKRAKVEAEKSAGVKIKQVLVGIGGITIGTDTGVGSVIIAKADSEVTHLDVKKALEQAEDSITLGNKKIIDSFPFSYKIDGKEVLGDPEGMKGVKLEARTLFVTVLGQHVDNLILAVSEAGLEVIDIIPAPIASAEAILTDKQKMAGCILANIGSETLGTITYEESKLVSLAILPIGGNDITNDIALGLKVPLEEAEGMKTGSIINNVPGKKLTEIINARLEDMFELIDTNLKKIRRSGLLPAGLILIGASAQFSNIEEEARATLHLPTKSGIDTIVERSKGKLRDTAFAVAYGVCILEKEYPALRGGRHGGMSFFNIKQFFIRLGKQLLP